jgi:phospholipid N-methyltransferase
MGKLSQICLFAMNFIKHPSMVGGVMPSSPFLVDEVLRQIEWDKANVIVEYGPGLGSFTTSVLKRMRPDAKLIALEINPDFIRYLKATIDDPRFCLVQESATEVKEVLTRHGCPHADYIISGIPFSALPHKVRDTIVRRTHAVLRPQGSFLVYQVSGAVRPYLQQVFGNVASDFELLNIVPARMFYCAR